MNIPPEKINLAKQIKSLYIFKYILSFLYENKKLCLIIYNKEYQNKLGIDIEHYKEISGKYIIKDNLCMKEYELNSNKLMYEGEYSNGKRNGKGKEYYNNGKIKFQGEYLNGKRYKGKGYDIDGNINLEIKKGGKGKEYYKNGKIKFKGEFYNERKWNGKGYNCEEKEVYEIKNGKGYIKEYDDIYELLIYEGEYINGKRHGKGKEYYFYLKTPSKRTKGNKRKIPFTTEENKEYEIKFEGEYSNGKKWNGKGYSIGGIEEFEIKKGNGYIKEYSNIGELRFECEYKNGRRNGKGKEYDNNRCLIFEGEYKNGERNGEGKEYYNNKLIYEGDYLNGKRSKGRQYYSNGMLRFEGEYLNGKRKKGKAYDFNGELIFEGEYK